MKYLSSFILAAIALIVMASCEKSEVAPVVVDAPAGKEVNDKVELPRVKYGGGITGNCCIVDGNFTF